MSQPAPTCLTQLPDRFIRKIIVHPLTSCWVWQGSVNRLRGGYGNVWWKGRMRRVHRIVYLLLKGCLPPNLDHLCRNVRCVNPHHLDPVTRGENVLRGEGFMAQRKRQTHCKHGHPFDEKNTYITFYYK